MAMSTPTFLSSLLFPLFSTPHIVVSKAMKPCDEGEVEGRRRSNANRSDTGSRRSATGTQTPQRNDIDVDRYRHSWRYDQQTQEATQQRNDLNNIAMETRARAGAATTALDTSASARGTDQKVVVPQEEEETGDDNFFTQGGDDDADATCLISQEQAQWNSMVLPDSASHSTPGTTSSAGAAIASHLGYYCKEDKQDEGEDAKVEEDEEQVMWDGMVHPDASPSDIASVAVSSTTVTDSTAGSTNSDIPSSNKKENQANGQNQRPEQETQQNNDSTNNVMTEGAANTTSPPASTAGAFAVCGGEMVLRGGEDDTFTQVSEVGTSVESQVSEVGTTDSEQDSVLSPHQNTENGSTVLIQAHLAEPTEEVLDSQERRIQQLEALVQRQQQQLQHPLVHAEIASSAPEEMLDNNHDKIPPPPLPVHEKEQQGEGSHKGAMRSWMENRRNRSIALGAVAVVSVAVVVAIAVPLANSNSPSSSNEGAVVVSNNNTSPPSTSSPSSEESNIAPVTTSNPTSPTETPTRLPIATSNPKLPTEAPTRPPTSAPTSHPPTRLPSLAPTITMSPTGRRWLPVGQELGGRAVSDRFGESVSLSRDARVLAVGASQTLGRPGHVSIFELDESTGSWMAKGQELVGQAYDDRFGQSVALNGDGTILAVGAFLNDGGGTDAGHVRVFQHDMSMNRWVQLGSDINGDAAEDWFGGSVSLSKAGDILAAGAFRHDNGRGSARTFRYDHATDSWIQLGQKLFGQAEWNEFGHSVSLSSSGEIVAVGARWNDLGGYRAGQVLVYQYKSASSRWDLMGSPINGQVVEGWFGFSVSLDNSGMVVAVGAPGWWDHSDFTDSRVLVYAYDGAISEWVQRGQELESQETGNNGFGFSVSLSGKGDVLAVGRPYHGNGLGGSGQVTIFQHNVNIVDWDTVGESLNGKAAHDWFGTSVSLSEDGTVVAVGATGRDYNGINLAGSASVHTLN